MTGWKVSKGFHDSGDLTTPQKVAKGNGTLAISGKYRLVKYPYGSKDPLLGMHLGYNLGGESIFLGGTCTWIRRV